MENKTRIEFIKGESNCRFDGIILNEDNCKKLYGYEGEVDILSDDTIIIDNIIYSNQKFGEIIKMLGEVHGKVEEYDEILSQGRGFASHCKDKELEDTVVISLSRIDYIDNLKPFEDFKKDYPNFNLEKYSEIYDELDKYYSLLQQGAFSSICK